MAKEQGAKGDRLVEQIDTVPGLEKYLKDLAHDVRLLGNAGAHPDENVDAVDEEMARLGIDFTEAVFNAVYVRPKQAEELRTRLR
jgi:hypothetical protein